MARCTEGGVLLSVVNRGGNKLDWFVDVEATMSVTADAEGDEVEVHVWLEERGRAWGADLRAGPVSRIRARKRASTSAWTTLTVPRYDNRAASR